jgi:hypothetical protein
MSLPTDCVAVSPRPQPPDSLDHRHIQPHQQQQDPRLLLDFAQPILAIARAQAQLHARRFAEEAAAAAQEESRMEAAAGELRESYYGLVAQRARLEQELVRGGAPRLSF